MTGEMQNQDANQLPEVDSLPDGFVDSTTEPLAPPTPKPEQEKLLNNYKESDLSDAGHFNDSSNELAVKEYQNNHDCSMEVPCSSLMQQTESTQVAPSVGDSDSKVPPSSCSEVKDQQGERQSLERNAGDCLETKVIPPKDSHSSETADSSKTKKPEPAETKRKSSKRMFKSEKELLEFTLKYQQVLAERDAALAVRDKLESLCRELQRQNKMLMEECKRVSTEGQNLRLDLSAKFQDAIKDVGIKLEEQKDECLSQLKENEMLRNKLKQLADQYVLYEQQYDQKLKQKALELQIADLKIKQYEEKLVQEQSQMKVYAEQVSQLLATEKNLRLQLTADGEKFQEALLKSSEVFETFKQEIEKMTKSIKELKKENQFLKSKTERSDVTLIELVDERERLKKQLEKTKNQKEKLESLCRSLQAERKQNLSGSKSDNSVPT